MKPRSLTAFFPACNDGGTIGRTSFGVSNVEKTGIDLLQSAEGGVRSRLEVARIQALPAGRLRVGGTVEGELGCGEHHGRCAEKATPIVIDLV